jgi:hypothetical protein
MRSPFPGMDPYLETRWSDVHVKLIGFIGEALQPNLPSSLRARAEERILVEETEEEPPRGYRTDVAVVDTGRRDTSGPGPGATVATVDPIVVGFEGAPTLDRFIQIIDVTSGNKVVTAIEVLSPWNKAPGRLNRDYLRKLDDYGRGGVSVVEIDLLRHPSRGRLPVTEADIPAPRRTPYLVCVRRGWFPDQWKAYPLNLRYPLPPIPVPLRPNDPDIGLELQPLIERIYVSGGHDDIDYARPPDPPLEAEDAAWADELLKAARKR